MCGIVAYIGKQNATPIVINGLRRLEYRGYDSAGIAILEEGKIALRRVAGKITQLENLVNGTPLSGELGIGHTRWATHGAPIEKNAHPHLSASEKIVVVHNGIVENYLSLKQELIAEGAEFKSDTDTETIVNLIEKYYNLDMNLYSAVKQTISRLKGAHSLVVMSSLEPNHLIAARLGNAGGVAIGIGDGEMFIASDVPAIIEYTRKMVFLEFGQIANITRQNLSVETLEGQVVTAEIQTIPWDPITAVKGNYRHFMQKEIHEQVRALSDTLSGRIDFDHYRVSLPDLDLNTNEVEKIKKSLLQPAVPRHMLVWLENF